MNDNVLPVLRTVAAFLGGAFKLAWQAASAPIGAIRDLLQDVINVAQRAIDTVGRVTGAVGNVGGGILGGVKSLIPGLAEGGIVTRPTLVLAGESGTEAILPLSRLGGLGGRTVNLNVVVHVEGSVISEGDLGSVVVETVQLAADRGEIRLG